MIARAAFAALAISVSSLASSSAAAQPAPPPPAPFAAPPQWIPLPPPPGYAPAPMIFRDGAWRPFVGFTDVEPPPSLPSGRDPLFPTGVTLGIGGVLTTALGVGLLASAASSMKVCGLSGCLRFPDTESQNYAAGLLAGGVTAAVMGGTVAYFSVNRLSPARTSNTRTVIGVALTTAGVAVAMSGVVNAATPYGDRPPIPGEVFPQDYYPRTSHTSGATLMFTLVSAGFLAVGLPMWITGARAPFRHRRARDAASRLDLLPSAGGAAIRWTR